MSQYRCNIGRELQKLFEAKQKAFSRGNTNMYLTLAAITYLKIIIIIIH